MPLSLTMTTAILAHLLTHIHPPPATKKNFDNGFDFDDAPAVVELDLQTVEQPVNITNDLNDELDYVTLSTSMDFDDNVKDGCTCFRFLML